MITLNDINHWFISNALNEDIKRLIWSIIIDRWLLKNKHKLFYNEFDKWTETVFRVIDEKKFEKFKPEKFWRLQLKYEDWLIKEFFWSESFILELPINDNVWAKDITAVVTEHFLWTLAKERLIDDLLFIILKQIFSTVWVYYTNETRVIWFWTKQRKKYAIDPITKKRINIWVTHMSLEDVLDSEIKQWYINKKIWDKYRWLAYTHLLREHAKFRLTHWWRSVLINWRKYNIIAASRGQGKTYMASYIACRWLLDEREWFGWRNYREIKYFVPNKEDVWTQVMEYIKSFIWDLASFKLESWKKAFEFWKYSVKCNITWNVFKIISLYNFWKWWDLWTASWEWLACDLAIIDEAARISDQFWISFHQRAAFETQEFYISSTINEETPVDHWFYRLLVEWDSWVSNITSHRITIDDNEIMRYWKTDAEWKEQINKVKEDLRKRSEKEFYCRLYCIILEESNVFNLTWTIIWHNESKYQTDDVRILWFDLWKLDDTAWLSMINLTHMEIESSIKVSNLTYWMQLTYAQEYKDRYPNLFVIWDRSWVWEAVSEQDIIWTVDVWIKSTWQWELNFNKKLNYYTANKWLIINTFASILNNNVIKIPNNNVDLIDQLNNFVKMKSWRWEVILYKWKWKKKDDLVLSSAYAIFYMASILKLKTKTDIEQYVKQTCNTYNYSYNDESYSNWNYYQSLY